MAGGATQHWAETIASTANPTVATTLAASDHRQNAEYPITIDC
jgi:hypothetical protein